MKGNMNALRHAALGIVLGTAGISAQAAPATPIANQYIVELNTPAVGTREHRLGLSALVQSVLVKVGGGQVLAQYEHALLGFAVRLSANQAAALAKLPGVRRVEPDRIMTASEAQSGATRSEEHTSDPQSLMRISYAVFCLNNKN